MAKKSNKLVSYKARPSKKSKNRHFVARQNNADNFMLLTNYNDFNNIIIEIRKKFDIPVEGLLNDQESQAWHDQMDTESSKFKQFKETKWFDFADSVNKILKRYNLPNNYLQTIKHYLLFNTLQPPLVNFSEGPYEHGISFAKPEYIRLNIYTQLTDKELEEIKKYIKRRSRHLPKYKKIKKLEEQLGFLSRYRDRDGFDYATNKKYKISVREIASELDGKNLKKKMQKVYDAERKLKLIQKKRFGKKLAS